MSPSRIKIGDLRYKFDKKRNRWAIKSKMQPQIAYIKDNTITLEPITKELLNDIKL